MKILFYTLSKFSLSPNYKRALGMGEELAKLGYDVYIAALDCEENRARSSREAPNCKFCWFRQRSFLGEAFDKIRMAYLLRPDLVYSTVYSPRNCAFMRIFLPWGLRFVTEFCELYSQYGLTQRWWKFVETFSCFENSGLLCSSRYIFRRFEKLLIRLRLSRPLIYSPYAYPDYLKETGKAMVAAGVKRVVFMAYLVLEYGVRDVVDACARLMRCGGGDFAVDIIGKGPELDSMRKRICEVELSDKIVLHGYVDEFDLPSFFRRADVFVAPMRRNVQDEARCPSKVYYYIPYNKPIVTCKFGEPYEALQSYGFYYEAENADDMAKAIRRALDECDGFSMPKDFVDAHAWSARALAFDKWLKEWRGNE